MKKIFFEMLYDMPSVWLMLTPIYFLIYNFIDGELINLVTWNFCGIFSIICYIVSLRYLRGEKNEKI